MRKDKRYKYDFKDKTEEHDSSVNIKRGRDKDPQITLDSLCFGGTRGKSSNLLQIP